MKTKSLRVSCACLIFGLSSLICAPSYAQDSQELKFATERVSDSVYMLYGKEGFVGGNIGLTIGEDGVVMIDNGMPNVLDKLKAEIAKTTDKPIDYLINTHVHGDHTGNNHVFGSGDTKIISHDNLRKSLVTKGMKTGPDTSQPAPKEALPILTFSDRMTIHVNGDAAKIIHFQNAHTDGDAIVVFEKANVIHTGDIMFNQRFPYIDTGNGGSLSGVIAALKGIYELANDDTKIIAGHGPLASKQDVADTIKMLETSSANVQKLIDEGKSDEEIQAANPLAEYESFSWGFINTEKMINQLIEGLRG